MREKESLETILKRHARDNHVKHFDALEAINHHVVVVIFFSILFLFGLVMFFTATPDPEFATAYAIFEFQPIHVGIFDAIGNFIDSARVSPDRPYILLTLYTSWIIIFGLANMFVYEWRKR
jgi:hypothetical protein